MIVYFNREFVEKEAVALSLDDRGFMFGDGVYEVIRCYRGRGKFFEAEAHLDRMRRGLGEIRISGWEDIDFLSVARTLLERNALAEADAVIYMQVTRGAPPTRTHYFPEPDTAPTVYMTAFPYVLKADADAGVSVVTTQDQRWGRCDIKTIGLLANCLAQQQAREEGALEALLVSDGLALEATAASLFGVFGGELLTAPTSANILPSITRAVVLKLCRENSIPVRETAINADQLGGADELFLAGTTLEIMPIVKVDGSPVGRGVPGPLTSRIRALFGSYVYSTTGAERAVSPPAEV
ncbi:MAG: aminotransferase class IV [Gemmatimonadetes bacterium]|nr:aminotransferase class IV [Gemmatimonadota bacterium]